MRTTVTFEGRRPAGPVHPVRQAGHRDHRPGQRAPPQRRRGIGGRRADPPRRAGVQDPCRQHRRITEQGDRVFVHCTITTDTWTDKQTNQKRTAQRVLAEIVGPSLRWATTRITKTTHTPAADDASADAAEQEA